MNVGFKIALAIVASTMLAACAPAVKTYVDPQYRHATFDTVHRLAQPIPVRVGAQFELNGTLKPALDAALQSQVEQALRSSGVFLPSESTQTVSTVTVVTNDIADVAVAWAKGFRSGLTFGTDGSMVPDNYEVTITYRASGETKFNGTYKHRLITILGRADGSTFGAPATLEDGFHHVIEDTVLNFIQEMQDRGVIDGGQQGPATRAQQPFSAKTLK